MSATQTTDGTKGHVLVVDDDVTTRMALKRQCERLGYSVECASSGKTALEKLSGGGFSAILSDLNMPQLDGLSLLRAIRDEDLQTPVLLLTGDPTMDSAIEAVALGAFRYLRKPVDASELKNVLEIAVHRGRVQRLAAPTEDAAEFLGDDGSSLFEEILETVYMAYQPLVRSVAGQPEEVYGVEALLRAQHPRYKHPGQVIGAAEALGRLDELGLTIRTRIREDMRLFPSVWRVFVNLHPLELGTGVLRRCASLFEFPERVVFEITERVRLREVEAPRAAVDALRDLGFKTAVDDLGEGYSSVTSLTLLSPEYVKLDMSLIRDIHLDSRRKTMVGGLIAVCHSMGSKVVAEGVETADEQRTLQLLGADILQGYHFARPVPVAELLALPLVSASPAAGSDVRGVVLPR